MLGLHARQLKEIQNFLKDHTTELNHKLILSSGLPTGRPRLPTILKGVICGKTGFAHIYLSKNN